MNSTNLINLFKKMVSFLKILIIIPMFYLTFNSKTMKVVTNEFNNTSLRVYFEC